MLPREIQTGRAERSFVTSKPFKPFTVIRGDDILTLCASPLDFARQSSRTDQIERLADHRHLVRWPIGQIARTECQFLLTANRVAKSHRPAFRAGAWLNDQVQARRAAIGNLFADMLVGLLLLDAGTG